MQHNASILHLQNHQEVILYYCLGRWTSARAQGMLFLMHDAMIVPIGQRSQSKPTKTEHLMWNVIKETNRIPRRVMITCEEVRRMGYTAGCRGCRSVNQGLPAEHHSETCRKRFEDSMRARGDPSLARAVQRLEKGWAA